MTPKKLQVAMCGLGQWGPNLLRNLRQNPDCEVVALCDQDAARLEEFRELHPDAQFFEDVEDVAKIAGLDAVVLATPAGFHAEHARLLLQAGLDVLVEKPLAMTLEEGRSLVEEAHRCRRVLMAGHTFLFNPSVRRTKQEIDAGTLGDLEYITAQRLSLGRIRSDCNALWNLAPHDVSILLYWLDRMPDAVSAHGMAFRQGHQQEDIALCVLEFPGRVIASVQVSWMNPIKVRQMTLVGNKRMLIYDDVDQEAPLTLYDQSVEEVALRDPQGSFERYQLQVRRGPKSPLSVEKAEPLALEVAHFLECVRERREPLGSGAQALRITSVLEALDRSLKNSGESVVPEPA